MPRLRTESRVPVAAVGSAKPKSRPFRLTAVPVPELALHEATAKALDLLLLPPAAWTTFPAGSIPLPPQWAAKLRRMGLKPGWPDILVVHGGRIIGVELKRIGGVLSRTRTVRTRSGSLQIVEGQRDTFARLQSAGMIIVVCETVQAVLSALTRLDVPIRATY